MSGPSIAGRLAVLLYALFLSACGATGGLTAPATEAGEGAGTSGASPPVAESATAKPEPDATRDDSNDPWEGFNRAVYTFNDKFDTYVGKPVAKGYRAVLPTVVRRGISNFFSNLRDPAIALNQLLQGKLTLAASDLGRFVTNTTVGVLGLFDVASSIGLDKHDEDFGQTLGRWGVGEGPYLVLPFFGPRNVRDTGGLIVDWETDPITYVEHRETRYALWIVDFIDRRAQLLDASDILQQAGGTDPYIFLREAYRQRRRNQIYDGNPPAEKPPELLFEDDTPAPKPPAPSPPQSR